MEQGQTGRLPQGSAVPVEEMAGASSSGSGQALLWEQLREVEGSLGFLLVVTASICLSFLSLARQRGALCQALAGEEVRGPELYPIQHCAGSMVLGSTGFFFVLSIRSFFASAQGRPGQRRAARMNLWAGLFVMAASILRLEALDLARADRQNALLEAPLPE